ncbi:Inorganic pyrophosphatase, mitochondrial [Candida viswanathii]|uniref:inorganic diphosphatase n=1 Tax=Candida viswanathii TaxID=5486 RepID=A0A367YCJ5_9ASCO|nr:Inorganic pyrophosphatase, mitochondrial [Candida viswanathii]
MSFLLNLMKQPTRSMGTAMGRLALTNQHLHMARCSSSTTTTQLPDIIPYNQGTKYTVDYANYATTSHGHVVSYFHDIPLNLDPATNEANIVIEIPRWTNAKFEIDTKQPGNPIVQDTKKGQVRFVKNLFPHHGYIHNYGALPQTWEDPTTQHHGLFGDNDPVDVCEVGAKILATGDVKRVRILGALALIDDGELDWKVIVVNVEDPLAKLVSDVAELDEKCPGLLDTTRQWFRDYKLADGKPKNEFAFNGEYKSAEETVKIIQQCHESWKKLVSGEIKTDKTPNITNTTIKGLPGYTDSIDVKLNNPAKANAVIPIDVEQNYFIKTD